MDMIYFNEHLRRKVELCAWIVGCLAVCAYYVLKTHVGPDSSVAQHAQLNVSPPFLFRLLLPMTLASVLPPAWLDLDATRISVATMFALASVWLMPTFFNRTCATLAADGSWRPRLALLVILVAHYCLPRNLKFYYVYDLPAITFYMISFLALTSANVRTRWMGVILTALFAANRETVGIAALHAMAWEWGRGLGRIEQPHPPLWVRWAPAGASVVAVLAMRKLISTQLDHTVLSSFSWMEGDQLRLLANLERMATKHHHGIALLWFGAGAIIWLPKRWGRLPPPLRQLLIASIPVFVFFCIVGNFVELRMFSELLPLLAAALAFKAPASQTQTPERA